jgi:hypothetical protein
MLEMHGAKWKILDEVSKQITCCSRGFSLFVAFRNNSSWLRNSKPSSSLTRLGNEGVGCRFSAHEYIPQGVIANRVLPVHR